MKDHIKSIKPDVRIDDPISALLLVKRQVRIQEKLEDTLGEELHDMFLEYHGIHGAPTKVRIEVQLKKSLYP